MKRDIHNGIKMKIIRESVTQLTINAIGDCNNNTLIII